MKSDDIPEKQEVVRLLGKIKPAALEKILTKPDPFLLIELSEALPEKNITLDPRSASLSGGDPELGEIVFNENLAAQCVACHRVEKEGSEVGPPLKGIGRKGREYILESLIDPQAQVALGYGIVTLINKDGSVVSGALIERGENHIILKAPDGKVQRHSLGQMANLKPPISTMPPMGGILTPRQLRDLVEYLSGLK